MTPIVGIAIGAPYRRGLGVTVTTPQGIVEAVPITPDKSLGDTMALVDAATRAVRSAADILNDAGLTGVVLWAVESVRNPAGPRSAGPQQQQRAAARRGDVQAAYQARLLMRGVILDDIPVDARVVNTPPIGDIPADLCPAVLSGPKPAGWRGERGARREVVRTAWAAAEYTRRLVEDEGGAA